MSLDQLLEWIPKGGPEEALARQVEFDRLPRHVAIIMDGNGRWAGERHLPRVEGHRAGVDSVRDVVETSARLGIDVLTKVVPVENILFASEMIGAVRGIDPTTGNYYDDTKRYIEASKILSADDKHQIYEANSRRVFPRLDAQLKAKGL